MVEMRFVDDDLEEFDPAGGVETSQQIVAEIEVLEVVICID